MLEVRGLHASYATARVLRGVTLSVGTGEVRALLGRNGMGKTTLLRAISGLRPPSIASGVVEFEGKSVADLAPYQIVRRGLGYVPQGRRIFPSLTVEENARIGARPVANGWTFDRVCDLFPRLGERRRQLGWMLSGGEQQMLAIARALMTNPRLLIMDEPSEGLAPTVRDVILDRLRLLRESGQATLLAEQNVDFALEIADRVSVLGESGVVEWSGEASDLRRDDSALRALIGV